MNIFLCLLFNLLQTIIVKEEIMLVKNVMSSPAICVDEKTSIKEVVEIMDKENLGFLPITKNDHLIGVITDRDILLRSRGHKSNTKISKIMTNENLYTIPENATLEEAGKIMSKYKIRRLVVVNSDYIQGVITSKDLLNDESLLPYITQTYTNLYY